MKLFGFEIRRSPSAEQRNRPDSSRYSPNDQGFWEALGMAPDDLPPLSPQRATQTSAVYACVRVLAETVASLPLHLYKQTRKGPVKAEQLPEYTLLHEAPNGYQTSYAWREQLMLQAALWGNGYCEIQRDVLTGRVVGLYPLPAWEVQPGLVNDNGGVKKVFRIGSQVLEDAQVLHLMAPGWDGVAGISPISLHRASISMSLSAENFGAHFFKNGTRLSGVFESPIKLSAEGHSNLRESWNSAYAGEQNSGKVAILECGTKYTPIAMPLADAQYIETRKFQVADIARIFRIPPHMIGDLERATFSNIEHQAISFVQHTLLPWMVRFEQELNRKLFIDMPALKGRCFVKFNASGLLRGDQKTRFEGYGIARQWGVYSVNDIRVLEDLPPIDGGDVYLSPLNMVASGQQKPAEASVLEKVNE